MKIFTAYDGNRNKILGVEELKKLMGDLASTDGVKSDPSSDEVEWVIFTSGGDARRMARLWKLHQ